jgi:hypothetical protein
VKKGNGKELKMEGKTIRVKKAGKNVEGIKEEGKMAKTLESTGRPR